MTELFPILSDRGIIDFCVITTICASMPEVPHNQTLYEGDPYNMFKTIIDNRETNSNPVFLDNEIKQVAKHHFDRYDTVSGARNHYYLKWELVESVLSYQPTL